MILVRNGHERKRSFAPLEPNSAERPIYMTSCNHNHPTVINYCAIGQCMDSPVAEELQAISPHLRTIGMYQKDVDVACAVPLPDMRQTTFSRIQEY